MKNTELTGLATAEQIAQWKSVYGDVFEIKVADSVCYLRKPDRSTMKAIASIGTADPIRSNEVLLENCWLGGDDTIKTEDDKFFGVSSQLANMIEIKQAELKKL